MLKLLGIRSLISFHWCALSTNYVNWTKQNPFAAPYFTFNTRLVACGNKAIWQNTLNLHFFLYKMSLKRVPLVFWVSRDYSLLILTTKVDVQINWKLLPSISRDEHQICLALYRLEWNIGFYPIYEWILKLK